MEQLKTFICNGIRLLLRLMCFLPIKRERILFYPANGNYYCNLKYICQALLRMQDRGYDIVWVTDRSKEDQFPPQVRLCPKRSWAFFYYALTAKVLLFNSGITNCLIKRKGQTFIETWHGGGAYKRTDKTGSKEPNRYKRARIAKGISRYDYVISSSSAFTKAFREDMGIGNAEFCPYGMPRNDIFFDAEKSRVMSDSIRQKYRLTSEKIVLYAPTFRDNGMENTIDFPLVLKHLEQKYGGKFIFFLRCHPHVAGNIFKKYSERSGIIDVSAHPDMQELLCAADVLITDYSSCMWDFSLSYKPCFIYATDIDGYKQERNFHTPMSEWPFPIAEDNTQLAKKIDEFDMAGYIAAVKSHHLALGSYEDGHAAERVSQLISMKCSCENKWIR